jgi:cytochrome c oxidase subunit 1
MNPLLGKGFMTFTLIISVPAEVLFLNWLHTMWHGSNRFPTPMLFAVGTVFVFGLGGLTGLYLGTIATDIYLHDTMWVVGHFHLTMAAAAFLGSFCALYFWFPKMFGRQMNETLSKAHFWTSTVFITLVFCGQLVAGFSGQQRRLYDPYQYTYLQHLLTLNRMTSWAAFLLGASQFIFVINFFRAVFAGKKAEANPWNVGTLEWTHCESPPRWYNFFPIPTILRGPHEYANPEVKRILGKDWIGQAEPLPASNESGAAVPPAAAKA